MMAADSAAVKEGCARRWRGCICEPETGCAGNIMMLFEYSLTRSTAKPTAAQAREKVMSPGLVLTIVNAPHRKQLNAQELADCLRNHEKAKAMAGHISAFFGEVDPASQLAFAQLFQIPGSELIEAAKAFAEYAGASYPLAA